MTFLRIMRISFVLIIGLLLAACSSVDVVSQVRPGFSSVAFHKIMIEADIPNLVERRTFETEYCHAIVDVTDTTCVQSDKLFFPGKKYTKGEVAEVIQKQHIDAVMRIGSPSSATFATASTESIYGNKVPGVSTTQASKLSDLNTDVRSGFKVVLLNAATGKVVWYGSAVAESDDNDEYDFDDYAEDSAQAFVSQMLDDGVLHSASH